MRSLFVVMIGMGVGVGLCAIGVFLVVYGMTQPINICSEGLHGGGGSCGNLPIILGIFIGLAGLATFLGTVRYGLTAWETPTVNIPGD